MKGPISRTKYSCVKCDNINEITGSLAHCKIANVTAIWSYETPYNCPYLKKVVRKEKLKKINRI